MSANNANDANDPNDVYDEEARARNAVLASYYGRLPAYAIFSAEDVSREAREERLAWWSFFAIAETSQQTMFLARVWMTKIHAETPDNVMGEERRCSKRKRE